MGLGIDLDLALLLTVPFWITMIFINGKVMLEINRQWSLDEPRLHDQNNCKVKTAENLNLREDTR